MDGGGGDDGSLLSYDDLTLMMCWMILVEPMLEIVTLVFMPC